MAEACRTGKSLLALAGLRRTILVLEDFETQAEVDQKRELLGLRNRLDNLRKFEQDAAEMEEIIKDPDYSAEDHEIARKRLLALQRVIKTKKEIIAVIMDVLGIKQEKLELQRQLAALDDEGGPGGQT